MTCFFAYPCFIWCTLVYSSSEAEVTSCSDGCHRQGSEPACIQTVPQKKSTVFPSAPNLQSLLFLSIIYRLVYNGEVIALRHLKGQLTLSFTTGLGPCLSPAFSHAALKGFYVKPIGLVHWMLMTVYMIPSARNAQQISELSGSDWREPVFRLPSHTFWAA